ncbi:MAG TPA: DUF4349 domain-containing protein [Ktedonobacteraceae bacterium]|nr:DUF4349 domain-containing protein [Ktedonobacteraceae bacterium]
MISMKKHSQWSLCLIGLVGLVVFAVFFSACGGSGTMSASSAGSSSAPSNLPAKSAAGSSTNGQAAPSNNNIAQQYLIKSLNVTLAVKDTRQVGAQLQSWISATDPHATSAGASYTQTDNNQYNVSLTFSVQSTLYPNIYVYLRDYTAQHGGQLVSFTENVQDVTNDYIDTQSRLKNLRGEQQRLLTLLGQAQALNDILNIEQRLTDVEGQIESIEAHLNALNGQVTFYTVAITLQPLSSAAPAPNTNASGWNPGQVWQGAVSAVTAVSQVLATLFIWLLVFSVYIIPVACFALAVRWLRRRRMMQRVAPKMAPISVTSTPSQQD